MNWISRVFIILVTVVLAACATPPESTQTTLVEMSPAASLDKEASDVVFGDATNLGSVVNSSSEEYGAVLTPDGLELYFCSNRPGGQGAYDIWVTRRSALTGSWGPPTNLGPQINTAGWDAPASISADGLTLYLELSNQDIYTITRGAPGAAWGPPIKLSPDINSSHSEAGPVISADNLELFFVSNRPGGRGSWDIWVSARKATSDPWGPATNLGAMVNTRHIDICSWISSDGLALFFFSDRPEGHGAVDAWVTTRSTKGSDWGPPRNLGPSINTTYPEFITAISADERCCYFSDFGLHTWPSRPDGVGGSDIWQAPIMSGMVFAGK